MLSLIKCLLVCWLLCIHDMLKPKTQQLWVVKYQEPFFWKEWMTNKRQNKFNFEPDKLSINTSGHSSLDNNVHEKSSTVKSNERRALSQLSSAKPSMINLIIRSKAYPCPLPKHTVHNLLHQLYPTMPRRLTTPCKLNVQFYCLCMWYCCECIFCWKVNQSNPRRLSLQWLHSQSSFCLRFECF